MSWYKGVCLGSPKQFVYHGATYAWLLNREILLQGGQTLTVVTVESDPRDFLGGLDWIVTLSDAHGIPVDSEIWFTLVEPKAPPQSAPVERPAPTTPQKTNASASIPTFAYPALPDVADADDILLTKPRKGSVRSQGSGNQQPKPLIWFDETAVEPVAPPQRTFVPPHRTIYIPPPSLFAKVITMFLAAVLAVAPIPIGVEISAAIGYSSPAWLNVLAYTLIGQPAVGFVCCALIAKSTVIVDKRHVMANRLRFLALVSFVVGFVFVTSFGIPLARSRAQIRAVDDYLQPSMMKRVHCWRDPKGSFNSRQAHFIYLEEPQWIIDYASLRSQKVQTENGMDDDGKDNGKRYNFCLAPLRYTGVVPCEVTMFAACFRETRVSRLASCDISDARNCGWLAPADGVTLRVVNRNEEFFAPEAEEEVAYLAALAKTQTNATNPLIVFYGGDGPDFLEEERDSAEKICDILRGLCYSLAGVLFVAATWYVFTHESFNQLIEDDDL